MKKTAIIISMLGLVMQGPVMAQNDPVNSGVANQQEKILSFYRQYSDFTDPGEYVTMYNNLPDSIPAICRLIKSQLIHPIADLPRYRDQIPAERSYEDLKYPTVQSMLAGLKAYNPKGLVMDRKPADRLVVSCRYHAILLASILKHRGIPTRVRYGFATYLYPGYHVYHVICEVWNSQEQRWILVDADRPMEEISSEQFEPAGEVWMSYQQGKLDPNTYGVPDWWGAHVILDVLCHDLAAVLGNEYIYYDRPPVSFNTAMNVKEMPAHEIELMNRISFLLTSVDANFNELQRVYNANPNLQFAGASAAKK